ncbi:fimbrillin family protein [Bacteroides faecium]|uniref:Carbohydrate-binding domain-containing protein n=1 Tax=Bacteroides faecium TaxID=2715212 RepID=A0A6H0KIM8_9BACE|nr:fimbrillin family protein [Bacteroides faecium]QIU93262.1 carbohydrate-binding domain-containing protein [Bacteroides faecium]
MNIQQLIPYCLLAGLLSFSACESEQAAEMNEAGTELPDGMYPLTFTAVQAVPEGTPQTRVSENPDGTSSKWDGGEVIGVKIGNSPQEGSYTLDENGNVTATLPVYWQNTDEQAVYGWYPKENTDVSLTGQDHVSKFPYILKGEGKGKYNDVNGISLSFTHQLAKFRVKLEGTADNLQDAKVSFYGYTSCSNNQGTVTTEGKTKDYLPTQKTNDGYYTAILAPDDLTQNGNNKFVKIEVNENIYYYNPDIKLVAGNVYTYTVQKVNKPEPTTIDLTKGDYTIEKRGTYKVTGTISNHQLTVNADATVILDNVTMTHTSSSIIKIQNNATATLELEGTSTLTSTGGVEAPIFPQPNSTVVIQGNGTLNVTGAYACAGIGGGHHDGYIFTYRNAGNIRILGGTIIAKGGSGAAGIGCGSYGNCGTIEILGGNITATKGDGWGNNAIGGLQDGMAGTTVCEAITLSNCTINLINGTIKAKTITPDINNAEALKAANVTIN